jgi:hypothetical protein
MRDIYLGDQKCWNCGSLNDAATGIGENDPGLPSEGAVSICAYCAAVSVFTDSTNMRKPTRVEMEEFAEDKTILAAVSAVLSRNWVAGGMPRAHGG